MNPSQPNLKPSWLSRGHHVGQEIPHCGCWPCFPPTHITLMVLQSISIWLMLYPNSPTLPLLLGDIGRGSSDPCSSLIFIASIWNYDGHLRILRDAACGAECQITCACRRRHGVTATPKTKPSQPSCTDPWDETAADLLSSRPVHPVCFASGNIHSWFAMDITIFLKYR